MRLLLQACPVDILSVGVTAPYLIQLFKVEEDLQSAANLGL
jgi:hypothetical protein